jgi:hypothetical protein
MNATPPNTPRDNATGASPSGDLSGISEMFGLRDGQTADTGTRTGTDTVGRWVAATEGVDQPPDVSSRLVHGRYRLIAELGAGGMGVTYRAWDTAAGIPVVVKMPRREVRSDSDAMQRFAREIDAMLAVPHDHIVPITDHGDDDGCPFVVMRFLPGGSLADYRRRDDAGNAIRNPPGMLYYWLPGVAAALDHIHARGMLHRDVKPGNIFLDGFLKPYLGDFGIAKVVDESGGLAKEQTLTATKMAVGTPEYMAPELFKPRSKPNGRLDQYALAVTVYEMLSGEKPFKGDRAHIIVEHSAMPVPPLAAKVPGLPQSLCMAVEKGLAKKSEDRFATCSEFAAAVVTDLAPLPWEPGTVRLLCPGCKNILKMPKQAAGRTGKCPRCREALDVAADLGSLWLEAEERGGGSAEPGSSTPAAGRDAAASLRFREWFRQGLSRFRGSGNKTPICIPLGIRLSVIAALIITGLFGLSVGWQVRQFDWSVRVVDLMGTTLPPISSTLLPTLAYAQVLILPSLLAVAVCVLWFRRRAWPTVIASQLVAFTLMYWAMMMAAATLPAVKIVFDIWECVFFRGYFACFADEKPFVISDALADEYAAFKGSLSLGGPMILTDHAAKRFGEHQGGRLELWNVDRLTAVQAAELAKHQDELLIAGLTSLSDAAAAALGKRSARLQLNGPVTLSDTANAVLRANRMISFERNHASQAVGATDQQLPWDETEIVTLTVEQAKQLMQRLMQRSWNSTLWLPRLSSLTPEVARVLATHDGELGLNGLTDVPSSVATQLAKHKGALHLNGLATIPLETAESLAEHKGPLYLRGLKTLTPEVAQALARHQGDHLLLDGVRTLPPEAAKALANRNRYVGLLGLTTMPNEVAAALRANPNIAIPKHLR